MATADEAPGVTEEVVNRLCEQLGLKATKKNRILVARLVRQVGTDPKRLSVALKKATILS